MTVASNIAIVPRLLQWPGAKVIARVDELLTMVGLAPASYRDRWPDELSGGQRQRVGLARALAADPPLLLMDEPFGALDPITRSELHAEFRRLQATLQRAVVLVTHDMAEAFALADRVAVLFDGRIVACDTPAVVRAPPIRASPHWWRRDLSRRSSRGAKADERLIGFITSHRAEFIARLGEHVVLVLASTAIAAAIGIPLGILAARRPSIAKPIVALANLAQTIPSLALFGFLIPLPFIGGIGTRTALVALTVYAILPVLRGTITGIQGVPAAVIECAVAMGLTPRQVLTQVEWPLALPSIVSGLRVAVVIGVGTATIASAIGAGGLGDYIFRGLAMVDSTVILAGAVPAALLALACDAALALAGRIADPRRRSRRPWPRWRRC